jgi:hypothetical protein
MARNFAESTTTNITVTTTTQKALNVIRLAGVRSGESILLFGLINITTGANTSDVRLTVREGTGIAGTVVQELNFEDTGMAGIHTRTNTIMVTTNAFQDEPVYQLTVTCLSATGNSSVVNSAFLVLRLD